MNVHTERGQWHASFTIGYLAEVGVTEQILPKFPKFQKSWVPEHVLCIPGSLSFTTHEFGNKTCLNFFATELYYLGDNLKKWLSHYQGNNEEA